MAPYVPRAAGQGADVVLDGRGFTVEGPENGHWMGISLLDRASADPDAYRNEIFGPVLCVFRAKTYEEAMNIVNGSPFGNAGAVFTRNGGTARRFQVEVEVGRVGVNMPMPLRGGQPLLRRLEGLGLRRAPYGRQRSRALLHDRQGHHESPA